MNSLFVQQGSWKGTSKITMTVHDNGLADPAEAMAGNLHQILDLTRILAAPATGYRDREALVSATIQYSIKKEGPANQNNQNTDTRMGFYYGVINRGVVWLSTVGSRANTGRLSTVSFTIGISVGSLCVCVWNRLRDVLWEG
jgi:hypothetical protein